MRVTLWSYVIDGNVFLASTEEKANRHYYELTSAHRRTTPPYMEVFNINETGSLNDTSYYRYSELISSKNLNFLDPNHDDNQLIDILVVDDKRARNLGRLEGYLLKEEGEVIVEHLIYLGYDTFKAKVRRNVLPRLSKLWNIVQL